MKIRLQADADLNQAIVTDVPIAVGVDLVQICVK